MSLYLLGRLAFSNILVAYLLLQIISTSGMSYFFTSPKMTATAQAAAKLCELDVVEWETEPGWATAQSICGMFGLSHETIKDPHDFRWNLSPPMGSGQSRQCTPFQGLFCPKCRDSPVPLPYCKWPPLLFFDYRSPLTLQSGWWSRWSPLHREIILVESYMLSPSACRLSWTM